MIAAISSVVPTGRKMKGSETFMAPYHRRAWRSPARLRVAGRRLTLLMAGMAPLMARGFVGSVAAGR
ncbi:MAG TPA: hypothetical protein VF778_07005, partial [Xanthobacteraceae bacterium]